MYMVHQAVKLNVNLLKLVSEPYNYCGLTNRKLAIILAILFTMVVLCHSKKAHLSKDLC